MAKRELRERNELSCTWGLSSIIESCQGCPSHKLISDGRLQKKHIIDCPRKLDQITSFDEECRKIQNEVELASVRVKREQHGKMDSEFVDFLAKAHKRAMKKSRKASLTGELPSTSDEISLNKLKLAAILEASECFQRSIRLGMYGQVDEINMQMSAKAFVDRIFIQRRLICNEGTTSESKPFSEALKVLNSDKNLFLKLLPDPNSLLEKCSKNSSVRDSEKPGTQLTTRKGKMNKNSGKKTDYPPSDRIVILKPVPSNAKRSEIVTCHCSSMQFQRTTSRRVSDAKPMSFSFKEMKRKLKHTFGGTSDEVSNDRSTIKVGDERNCRGVDIMSYCSSSTSAQRKEKLCKKQDLRFMKSSDIGCVTETVRKKLDFGFSKKQEFDVILEAKRHLSARLNNVNSAKTVTSVTSPKALGRILSSPKCDLWPLSPRKDSQYCSYNTSPGANEGSGLIPNGGRSSCPNPLRPNTEVTSHDDYAKYEGTKISSLIQSTVEGVHDTVISMTENMKSNGESKTVEGNSILRPELHISEAPIGRNSTNVTRSMQRTVTKELHKDDDESVTHSLLDTLSENEAFTSSVDDFLSTPLSMKYQEEHRSPVSVLQPFFTEDENSPPSITHQTARQTLQPLRLDFEECSFESFPQNQTNCSMEEEQDHLAQYVDLILQTASLTWDQLSEIESLPDKLLDSSLLDEVEFLFTDCYFDPKLLFDRINEVLLEIYQSHFCSPPWLASVKPRIRYTPLAELVVDEIMTQAEFYLLRRTERRTLDQLVSKDVAECRSWLDVRFDTERIMIDVSEDVLEESLLEILLEFHT
ncbi:hypothetical protein CDL12_29171 [Handroanthus impetiginosus]|uniref:DUF4378 domain-containing protein n=1 Tax=Handroanthus impetiginosus TaxID=429701 RepID=A0A2G9G0B5_9LAMI|nr:hypothetical protein CDL12_29171 [Handroanthus impetiginosus]